MIELLFVVFLFSMGMAGLMFFFVMLLLSVDLALFIFDEIRKLWKR
jgi:hypothetical protein